MIRHFKTVDYEAARETSVRLGDCLPKDPLARFVVDIVFQVKSGMVGRGDIAKLNSDRQREEAELAVFLTLKEPTKGMRGEATEWASTRTR